MAIFRASNIRLYRNLPIRGSHTLVKMSVSARDTMFDNVTPYFSSNNLTFIRHNYVTLEGSEDFFAGANYGYYTNGGRRRFFFIRQVNYKSENTTELLIEPDLLMTMLPYMTIRSSYAERTAADVSGVSIPDIIFSGSKQMVLGGSSLNASFQYAVVLSQTMVNETPREAMTVLSMGGHSVVLGTQISFFNNTASFDTFLTNIFNSANSEALIGAFAIPSNFVSYTGVAGKFTGVDGVSGSVSLSVPSGSGDARVAKDNDVFVIADANNLNNRIEIPACFLMGNSVGLTYNSNPVEGACQYRVVSGVSGLGGSLTAGFNTTLNVLSRIDLPTTSNAYFANREKIMISGDTQRGIQTVNGIVATGEALLGGATSGAADASKAGISVGGGAAISAATAVAGTAIRWAQSEANRKIALNGQLQQNGYTMTSASGSPRNLDALTLGAGVVSWREFVPSAANSQISDYYRKYGHKRMRLTTPSFSSQDYFSGELSFTTTFGNADEIEAVRDMFRAGVWLWNDLNSFDNY